MSHERSSHQMINKFFVEFINRKKVSKLILKKEIKAKSFVQIKNLRINGKNQHTYTPI